MCWRARTTSRSPCTPLFGFMGHLEASGRKFTSAVGALDRSAGIVAASGAELVVFHPASCSAANAKLRSTRSSISSAHCARGSRRRTRGAFRNRGDGTRARSRVGGRRRRDLAPSRLGATRSRLRAQHATSDGAFLEAEPFREALEARRRRSRARSAVPHPFLGHRLRQPQRDETPALRRQDATS